MIPFFLHRFSKRVITPFAILLALVLSSSFFIHDYSPGEPDPGKYGPAAKPMIFPGQIPAWYLFDPSENGTDPIKFDIRANQVNSQVGQEVELVVTAVLLNTSNLMYYLPGSNAYTIKMLLPDGFKQTGGTFSMNGQSDQLSSSKPRVVYTIKGYFASENSQACFRLIRSFRGASDQSKFAVSARYCVNVVGNSSKAGITVASALTLDWCAEAESGSGNRPATTISGASGGQAVGGFGNSSEYMEYSVTGVSTAGSYTLSLYYCSGEAMAQFGIVINGTLQTASAPGNSSNSGPYIVKTVPVNLNSGTNTIRIQGNGAGFSLDKLCVDAGTTQCQTPTLSLGTPTCNGTSTYSVSFTASSGATVTASAGSISGSSVVNVPAGTNVTVTAASGSCTTQQTASSPSCGGGGSTSWCAEAESGTGNRSVTAVSGASGGQAVGGFGNSSEYMQYSVTGVSTAGSYTLSLYYCSGEATAQFGIVVNGTLQTASAPGNSSYSGPYIIKTVPVNLNSGTNTIRIQGNGAGFSLDKLCVDAGTTQCQTPTLSLSTPTCNGTSTYSVSFTASSGATVTASAGTVSGSSVVNVPAGTNVTVTAASGSCTTQQTASSPSCGGGGSTSWCAEAESGTGNRSVTAVSGASGGQAVGGFGNSSEYMQYSVTGVSTAGSYTLSLYYCSGEATAQFGIVVNSTLQTASAPGNSSYSGPYIVKTVSVNLNSGTNTIRIQGNGAGFSLDKLCVDAGTTQCQTPTLSLGTPTCNGTSTYSVSFTASSGATVTASAGSISGSSVVNVPVGTNVTVTAASGSCTTPQTATSPSNCNSGTGYSRVFVFGNSITHNVWGNGTNWGMAASAPNKDYLHILTAYLQTQNSGVDVREFQSFSTATVPGGTELGLGDGPRWEAEYWHLFDNPVYPGGLARYQAVQNWQPNLLIMRISENVTDWTHDFTTNYKQAIDYLIQQNPSCRVILTTSAWNQAEVSSLITSVGSERNYTVVNLNNITGAQAGEAGHPNDAAMQVIADRIWTGIQGSTPPVDPPVDPPSGFDWTPIPSTSVGANDSLVTFETPNIKAQVGLQARFTSSAITGPRVGGSLYSLFNKSESRYNYLHYAHYSITDPCCYAGVTDNYTVGMGYGEGLCLYMHPRPNYVPSQVGFSEIPPDISLGRNAYHGDDRGNTSKILQYGKRSDNSGYYVKTQPVLYNAYGAYAYGTIFEEWRDFSGKYYITHSKVTTNYTDGNPSGQGYEKQQYLRAEGQEAPCIYVNGSYDNSGLKKNKVFWYGGSSPCTGAAASNVDVSAGVVGTYMRPDDTHVTEPFVFVSSSENSPGLCMIMESSRLRISKMGSGESRWGDDADPVSPNTNATYISQDRQLMLDNQGVYYLTTKVYLADNLADARSQGCLVANRFPTVPSFTFNKADRMGWAYASYGDLPGGGQGKRTWDDPDIALSLIQQRGFWRLYFTGSTHAGLFQQNISWTATSTPKIYIKMAYSGNRSTWGVKWVQNEQLPNHSPSTPEESYRFPKGIAPSSQEMLFSVNGDGQARVYEIDLSGHSGWADKITEFYLMPNPGQDNTQGGQADIYWISTSPSGPSN